MNLFDQLIQRNAGGAQDSVDEPNPGEWLPLPPVIGRTFRWTLEAPDWAPPLPLAKLCEAEVVAQTESRLRQAYEDAVRRKLREALAHESLPDQLLTTQVRPGAVEDVRAHLSRHGRPRTEQPAVLTIADALPFIGRRPNRLLQCVDREAAVPLPLPSPVHASGSEEAEPVFLREKAPRKFDAPRVGGPPTPRERFGRSPFSLRTPLGPPSRWARLRATASDQVSVLLPDGALLTARDPRFGWALLRINGAIALTGQPLDEIEERTTGSSMTALIETFAWLRTSLDQAQAMTTAEETSALIHALLPRAPGKQPAAHMLSGRYGLEGKDLTLDACGGAFGMTRERIRQLQAAFESHAQASTIYAPALSRFADALEQTSLCAVGRLAPPIQTLLGAQTVHGALAAARAVLGRPSEGWLFEGTIYPPYGLTIACWSTRLAQPDVLCILRSARSMIARVGAFHITSVVGDVCEELRTYVSKAEVEAVVDSCEQFCWVDRDSGWGTLRGAGDAPVFTEVRKMLGVAHPISLDITDIFAGLVACRRQILNRDGGNRFGGSMPPPWVVRQVLEMQPDLLVAQSDNFKLREHIDPLDLIEGEIEKAIYRTLLEFGGVASWLELRQALVDTRVMNPISFGVTLKSSSIFYQPGYALYALRGWRLNVEQVNLRGKERSFPKPAARARYSLPGGDVQVFECAVNQTSSTKARRSDRMVYIPASLAPRVVGTFVHETSPDRRIRISKRGQVVRLAGELSDHGILPRETITLMLNAADRTYTWSRATGQQHVSEPPPNSA